MTGKPLVSGKIGDGIERAEERERRRDEKKDHLGLSHERSEEGDRIIPPNLDPKARKEHLESLRIALKAFGRDKTALIEWLEVSPKGIRASGLLRGGKHDKFRELVRKKDE